MERDVDTAARKMVLTAIRLAETIARNTQEPSDKTFITLLRQQAKRSASREIEEAALKLVTRDDGTIKDIDEIVMTLGQ